MDSPNLLASSDMVEQPAAVLWVNSGGGGGHPDVGGSHGQGRIMDNLCEIGHIAPGDASLISSNLEVVGRRRDIGLNRDFRPPVAALA